jgi:hypothetical protein
MIEGGPDAGTALGTGDRSPRGAARRSYFCAFTQSVKDSSP